MSRFRKIKEISTGWSDWLAPIMQGYKMACCDCGLIHELEFEIVQVKEEDKGSFTYNDSDKLNPKKYRVLFRARRNNRSTSQMRRRMRREQKA